MDLMDTDNDRFPLHTAAREGRGEYPSIPLSRYHKSKTNNFIATVAEALLKVRGKSTSYLAIHRLTGTTQKADPKLSQRKDDDGRYPVHWAASSNNLDIMLLLANQRSFDPDVQVIATSPTMVDLWRS